MSNQLHQRSYAIIGTGAIGGYYGACLQQAGFEVHFLLRSDYETVRKRGLIIKSVKGYDQ
jgi:2-dehydropantoate 2-reductase